MKEKRQLKGDTQVQDHYRFISVQSATCYVFIKLTFKASAMSLTGSGQAELCRLFLMVHESCKENGATPSQYMSFLNVYTTLYSRKQSQLTTRQQHLQVERF